MIDGDLKMVWIAVFSCFKKIHGFQGIAYPEQGDIFV
jgi:hypothetical protein